MSSWHFRAVAGRYAHMSRPFLPITIVAAVFVFLACLLDTPVDIKVGGIHSSLLEILAAITFVVALVNRKARTSSLWAGFIVVTVTSAIPLVTGVTTQELRHVLRDFSQISYISVFMIGYYIYLRRYLRPETFAKYLLWMAVVLSLVALFDMRYLRLEALTALQYSWRIIIAFSFFFALASLIGLPGIPRIARPLCVAILAVLVLYALQIRTRAFLLMLCFGTVSIVVGSVFVKKDRKHLYRLLLCAFLVVCIAGTVAATTNWVDLLVSEETSLGRIQSLQFQEYEKDVTANYRLVSWAMALTGFLESPLWGQGLGSYLYLDPWVSGVFDDYPAAMIHNTFLQILYNGGLVHMAGYMFLFYCVLASPGWLGPGAGARERAGTRLFLGSFFVSFLVYSAFSVTLFKITDAFIVWFIAGFLCGSARSGRYCFEGLLSSFCSTSDGAMSEHVRGQCAARQGG
jgi:O-antigen ligase